MMLATSEFVQRLEDGLIVLPSLITAGGVAVGCGVVGVFVQLKRHSLAALAIPQAVAIGVAVGMRLGWPTLPPALAAVAISIFLLASTRSAAHVDSLIAACYVGGLTISLLIIAGSGQHLIEMQNRFVGIDVAVDRAEMFLV